MSTSAVNQAAENSGVSAYSETKRKNQVNGKTIGKPELSEKAQKYYEKLKKKFGNMDFILVSADMKEQAEANASKYAQANRTVVLIDEDKIERMAEDESYRKKYEGIISGAASQIEQMKNGLTNKQGVKTFGIKIDDGGNASFFAVIDKSLAAQRKRIEEKAEQKADEKKKSEKQAREEKLEEIRAGRGQNGERISGEEDLVTVTAGSVEELMNKINNELYASLSDTVQTDAEKQIGQHFDFRG